MYKNSFKKILSLFLIVTVLISAVSGAIVPVAATGGGSAGAADSLDGDIGFGNDAALDMGGDLGDIFGDDSETGTGDEFEGGSTPEIPDVITPDVSRPNTVIINNGTGVDNNKISMRSQNLNIGVVDNDSPDGKGLSVTETSDFAMGNRVSLRADVSKVEAIEEIQAISMNVKLKNISSFSLAPYSNGYTFINVEYYAIGKNGFIKKAENLTGLGDFEGTIFIVLPKSDEKAVKYYESEYYTWKEYLAVRPLNQIVATMSHNSNILGETMVFDELAVHYDVEKVFEEYDILSEGKFYSEYNYTLSDGAVTIDGCDTTASGEIAVPSELFDCPVKVIADNAFSNCSLVTGVFLPDGIESIGSKAFSGCTSLTNIIIPETVTAFGADVFEGCSALTDIYYLGSSEVWNDLIASAENTTEITATVHCLSDDEDISDFDYIISEENEVTINRYTGNGGVVAIPRLIEGKPVKTIASAAFINKSNITKVIVPVGVSSIETFAFAGCSGITDVYIPSTVENIGLNIFKDCSSLKNIAVAYNNASFCSEDGILYDKEKTRILSYPCGKEGAYTMPESVTFIETMAFWNCFGLNEIVFSKNLTTIGENAFFQCIGLRDVILPDSLTEIGTRAFASCYNIVNITLPSNISVISNGVFNDCCVFESITIPASVTQIGDSAFYSCTELKDVYFEGTQEQWAQISIMANNDPLVNANMHYAGEVAEPVDFEYTITEGKVTITRYIGTDTDVVIPDYIEGYPVTSIGQFAFDGCSNISNISFGNNVTTIEAVAFGGCSSLTEITIPDSVTTIGYYSFDNCSNLATVTIGSGVTSIIEGAFSNCTAISDVYYNGTQAQWDSIYIETYNNCLTGATIHLNECAECVFGGWNIRTDATCITDGEQYRVCENCGKEERQSISATGHTFGDWYYSCAHEGYDPGALVQEISHSFYKHQDCIYCGEIITLPADDEFVMQYVEVTPTCTSNGISYYECPLCFGTFDYVVSDMLPHDYATNVVAPDCFNEGYTEYTCNDCGDSYVSDYTAQIANHNFVSNPYSNSKETKYVCDICGIHCADIYTTPGNKITNEYLAFAVSGTGYSLHTTGGDPDVATDNNARLLFGDLGGGTSDTIIRINGKDYVFKSNKNYVNATGDSIYSYNVYDGVLVQRYCNFVYNIYTQRKDTLEIKFVFTNISSVDATAGTRIFFDTMLGSNDSAPFRVPGMGDITYEKEFTGDNIPQLWQVFDSLTNPTVFASGTFYEKLSERPDKVQFISYGRGSSNIWDCSMGGGSIEDSAVNIYYNPTTIAAGQSRTVGTYYGLSQFANEENEFEIKATVVAPSELLLDDANAAYRNNPFTVNGWIVNESYTDILNNVKIKLELPVGLYVADQPLEFEYESIAAGANQAFAWQITALPKYKDTELTYKIILYAEGREAAEYSYIINIPALPATLCPHEGLGEWITVATPDCTDDGERYRICSDCDTVITEVLPALGHNYTDWSDRCYHDHELLPEMWIHRFERFRTCTVCQYEDIVILDESVYEFEQEVIAPTCTTSGYTIYTCSLCESFSYNKNYVAPLGHSYDTYVTPPTYFDQGYTTYVCARCGDTYIDDYVDPLDRTPVNDGMFKLEYDSAYYEGKPLLPKVYYYDENGVLCDVNGEFEVAYFNNNKVGRGSIRVIGINKYVGTSWLEFDISYEVIPEKIVNVIAIGEIGKISLSWAQSAEVNTDSYKIYRKSETESEFVLIKTVYGRSNLTYVDSNVEKNATYYYYITGVGLYGAESEPSNEVGATVQVDHQPPTILKINPTTNSVVSGQAVLSTKATDNIGAVKAKYYYSVDDGESWILIGETSNSALSISFDSTLICDETVKIKVYVYDAENNQSDEYIASYYIDNVGPDKVTGLAAEVLSNKITLTWNDVVANDAASFILETLKNGVWTVVARNIKTKGYVITGLEADSLYTYRVACVDVYGNVGEYSDAFEVSTALDTTAPVITSQSPSSSRYNSTITYSATAKDDCNIARIAIQVSTDLVNWVTISTKEFENKNYSGSYSYTINLSAYEDGSLFVRAIATDFAGNISDTSEKAPYTEYIVDRTAPSAPKNVAANGNEGYITISWAQGNEFDLSKYFVYRATAINGDYKLIASNLATLNFHDRNVNDTTEYFYKIKVSDSCGNMSEFSNVVSATVSPDNINPEITSITATRSQKINSSNNTITVSASDNNSLSSVVIEYYTSGNTEYAELVRKENINNHYADVNATLQFNGLNEGDYIYVRAYAVDMAGHKSAYVYAKYILDTVAPQVVDLDAQINASDVTLSWKDNGTSDISGFKIYRSNNGSAYTYIGSRAARATGIYTYEDYITSQQSGTYTYKVEAIDDIGNSSYELASVYYTYAYVNTAPTAKITIPAYLTVGVEELFDASASFDNVKIVKYLWDFGDGTTSNNIKVAKKYTAVGSYTVALTVTDDEGLSTTVIGTVEVKERESIGTLNVVVVDENGNKLSFVPVYFDLGSENQKIINTNSNGVATLQMSTGTHVVGMFSTGYLPVKKDVVVLANATRTVTLTTVKEELVTGKFEVTRMTFDEIVAAGIDVYDPDNQHVYSATARFSFGSTPPFSMNYIRNDKKIIDYTIYDYDGKPTNRYKTGTGEDRVIVGVTYIGGSGGWGGSGGGSGSGNNDIVAILDIPASASYLKEFFDVKLHIINNASSDFNLIQNKVVLNVPEGMTLMEGLLGDYSTSRVVNIPSIRGQQNVTLSWVLRGDKAGDYHLTADFEGTLAEFNQIVNATFKTEEPIKVYGLKGVKFRILAADEIHNDTLYFNVELENQRDIDIYMPSIGVTKKIFNVTESVLNKDPSKDFAARAYILNIYIQTGNGKKQYLPVVYDENGEIITNIEVLAPGQKLVFEYVVYNAINYAGIAYFKDAAITEFEGLIENIEAGSFVKEYYSFNDYSQKLDKIVNGTDSEVTEAFNYIMDNKNFSYMDKANNIGDHFIESLYEVCNTVINFDLSAFTQEEERDLIKRIVLDMLSDSSVIEYAQSILLKDYDVAVKKMLEAARDKLLIQYGDSEDAKEKISDAFKDFFNGSMEFAVTYSEKGLEGFDNMLDRKIAEKCGIIVSDDLIFAYNTIDAFTSVIEKVTKVVEIFKKAKTNSERDAYYFAFLKLQCNEKVSRKILETLRDVSKENAYLEYIALTNPAFSYVDYLINGFGFTPSTLLHQIATSLLKDLDKNMEDYDKEVTEVVNIITVSGIEAASSLLGKVIGTAIGSTPMLIATLAFNVIDAATGWGDYVATHNAIQVYAELSKIFIKAYYENVAIRNSDEDLYTMLYLRSICETRLMGEDAFKNFLFDTTEKQYNNNKALYDHVLNTSKEDLLTYVELWADEMQYNLVHSRDVLFNIEDGSMPTIPRAPVVTLDYENLRTVQAFSNEYEFCFADGEWKQCTGNYISFLVDTVPSTIRVRKAATDTTLAGEITTVRIFARKDLSKLINVKYDGSSYIFSNLDPTYIYEVLFIESENSQLDWSKAVAVYGGFSKLSGFSGSEYIAIRSTGKASAYETTSNPRVLKVAMKQEFTLKIIGKGTVSQTSKSGYYFIGDTIDLVASAVTGSEFEGWYIDGIRVSGDIHYLVEMSEDLVVTAKFTGASINRIELVQLPQKHTYYEGEELNIADHKIVAYYSDGTSVEVTEFTANIVSAVTGTSSVVIKYGAFAVNYDVEIVHNVSDWIIVASASHFKDGLKVKKCSVCDRIIESEIIPMIPHTYTDEIINPTCTEEGYTLHTCECGHTYKDNYTDALGHSYGDWIVRENANCTEDGIEYRVCETCNHEETNIIGAIGHNYEAIVTEPDCVNGGYTTHTCTFCDDTYVDSEVAALGHTYSDEWTVDVEPTYTTEGSKSHHCLYCDSKTDVTVMPALGVVLEYKLVDGEAVITGYQGDAQNLIIPAFINGYKVTSIANDAFYNNKNLVNITISNTVTYIGYWAFDNCDNITNVIFKGTPEEWNNIVIAYGNETLINANVELIYDVYGDVNDDYSVNSIDLIMIKKHLMTEDVNAEESEILDINGDGAFDILDMVRLKKYLTGVDTSLPNEEVNAVMVETAYIEKYNNYISAA